MKIGIITLLTTTDNYGQILQAYALQKYLKNLGHDARHIIYTEGERNKREQVILLLHSPFKRVFHIVRKLFATSNEKTKSTEFAKSNPRYFGSFKKLNISTYEQEYIGAESIRKNPPLADVYITGSDQVWGQYDWREDCAPYYLDFGGKKITRVAYAASFGRDNISNRKKRKLEPLLKEFKGISVREQSGINICTSLGYHGAIQVVDPTILLSRTQYTELLYGHHVDEWNAEHKIFCYFLNFKKGQDIYWNKIQKLQENYKTDVRLVISSGSIPAYDRLGIKHYYSPDIYNWIYSIKSADYIITNSFHGLVFSILFHKRFSVLLLKGALSAMNVRFTNFLSDIGLGNRICNNEHQFDKIMSEEINWEKTDNILDIKRKEGALFITQNIG